MKTRQSIAMALTIVLSLVAGTLLVWQVSLRHSNDRAAALDAAELAVTPVAETGRMLDSPDAAQANTTARQLSDSAPDCQFGFRQEYNADGSKGDYHCLNSAYWDYTTETLEQMVYADAEAARVLAHRLKDTDYPRALRLALRSAALSGGDVTAIMEARFWRPLNHKNGDADISGVAQAYMLVSLAHQIRFGEYDRSTQLGTRLRTLTDDPDAMMRQLDELVHRLYDDVQQIELDVTGQSTIGGNGDA